MIDLSPSDLRLLRALEDSLPLVERPYAQLAAVAGISEDEVIARIQQWTADGIIRRFGARVAHRSVGFGANGMSVWDVPPDKVDATAAIMTALPAVSHCYLRKTFPGWPYSLYAMIHGTSEEEVRGVAKSIADKAGVADYDVLFSSEEFKKTAPRYFSGD